MAEGVDKFWWKIVIQSVRIDSKMILLEIVRDIARFNGEASCTYKNMICTYK